MGIRIQFDLDDEETERFLRYGDFKHRHYLGKRSFLEWITRHEGKDSKLSKLNKSKLKEKIKSVLKELLEEMGVL